MPNINLSQLAKTARNKIADAVGESSGTAGDEEQGLLRDPRPYNAYYSNGIFAGQNNRHWMYFAMPEDIQTEWTSSYRESADNQSFLTNIFNSLGKNIYNSNESTKKDQRIKFHIAMIREMTDKIAKYDGITPAHASFLDRMVGTNHPVWYSYFGVELQYGDIHTDVSGFANKTRNYLDFMLGNVDVHQRIYKEFMELLTGVCMDNGMRPLDFDAHPEDFERLTAWHGQSDYRYGLSKEMASSSMEVPEHGKSIFCGAGEVSFSAIKPREARDMFTQDPFNVTDVRFGQAILRPSAEVVHCNIRGEIRSPGTAANLFDDKSTRTEYKQEVGQSSESSSVGDRVKMDEKAESADIAAAQASKMRFAWLDNVEITVATLVNGRHNPLNEYLEPYGLTAVNITSRQHTALCSTAPCYPNPIFKVPAKNNKRNPNVNSFYGGVLALSGLFRSTKPAGPGGVLLGLSDAGYEYKEIFSEVDAAFKHGSSPATLISGATGSGKTIQMLMMIAQTVYMGKQAVFLNPKPSTSLKAFFELLKGRVIKMSSKDLEENPGLLDPMFFIEDREAVGRLLAEMVIRAQGMNAETNARTDMIRSMEELTTEMIERAKMPANQCSYDIIFGNRRGAADTPRLSDDATVDFVRTKMISSPFWKATISMDPGARSVFRSAFESKQPLLIEWDNSIVMPMPGTAPERWTPSENDGVQSVVNLFRYAYEIIGFGRSGGMLAIDEAHVLKNSEYAMSLVTKAGREWRSANISLLLATQNLRDFLGDDEYAIGSYIRQYIIMRIDEADPREIDLFYRITKLPRDDFHTDYMVNAGVKSAPGVKVKKSVPNAYVIDNTYEWQGGIICGPWPHREMAAALSDTEADRIRDEQEQAFMDIEKNFFNPDVSDPEEIRRRDEESGDI